MCLVTTISHNNMPTHHFSYSGRRCEFVLERGRYRYALPAATEPANVSCTLNKTLPLASSRCRRGSQYSTCAHSVYSRQTLACYAAEQQKMTCTDDLAEVRGRVRERERARGQEGQNCIPVFPIFQYYDIMQFGRGRG